MPSNDERREVAARLREKHCERQGTFEPQSISIQAMNRLDDLLDCLPKRRDMFLDLADLIEPEERTCEGCVWWSPHEPTSWTCLACSRHGKDYYETWED